MVRFHAKEREQAVQPGAPNVAARFHAMEPIRVAAKGVRCVMALRAVEPIHDVQSVVTVADRTGAVIRPAKEADRIGAAIPFVMDDPFPCSCRGLEMSAANQLNRATNHVMGCCVRFPANSWLEAEFVRRFDTRFHVRGDQDELSGRSQYGLAWNQRWRRVSAHYDPATQRRVERHELGAIRLNQAIHESGCPHDQNQGQVCVR